MRSRTWVILILIAAVLAVVLAKRATKSPSPPEAAAVVQAPQTQTPVAPAGPPPSAAGIPAEVERPPTSPEPAPPEPTQAEPQPAPEQQAEPQPAPEQQAEPQPPAPEAPAPQEEPAPEAAPAAETPQASPEPVEPLPGSKLAECLQNGRPTMADFGAGWCRPCKQMEPALAQAAAKYAGKADILYVDVGQYGSLARQYGIRLIPTQIFFDSEGKEVSRNTGVFPIESIDRQFAELGVQQ